VEANTLTAIDLYAAHSPNKQFKRRETRKIISNFKYERKGGIITRRSKTPPLSYSGKSTPVTLKRNNASTLDPTRNVSEREAFRSKHCSMEKKKPRRENEKSHNTEPPVGKSKGK